ncbi:MAG: hypothetical protein M1837_007476 [Sclerophora amabilis]|nr:MAG: hypothetical protein M1837_007476 [Sclerophora amabilis]
MGANDAAYGIEPYYKLSYTVVSLVFLSPFIGYALAAVLNNHVHMKLGRRGVSLIGPGCHLVAWLTLALHPPYPVLVVVCVLAGFGNGCLDAAWNAWLGNMANANELLGFLHGFYGLGATLGPLIATTMVTKARLDWFSFYYVMAAGGLIELVTSLSTFWTETGEKFRRDHPRTTDKKGGRTREAVTSRSEPFASGISAVGFWLGITAGRVVLGFVTPRIGEKLAIMIYLGLSLALELLFWLVPQFIISAIAVALLGFFLGPLFPGAMVVATKLLPPHLHVSAIGFTAAFGGGGAALFPFAVGALAQAKGSGPVDGIAACPEGPW